MNKESSHQPKHRGHRQCNSYSQTSKPNCYIALKRPKPATEHNTMDYWSCPEMYISFPSQNTISNLDTALMSYVLLLRQLWISQAVLRAARRAEGFILISHYSSGDIERILIMSFTQDSNQHYYDVIMGAKPSQITSLAIVYSNVYSGADQRKHQSSASLAFVWGIHRGPVNSPHKWPVTRKKFPFDDVIMSAVESGWLLAPL